MFKNLLLELLKNNMKISDVAASLNITEQCLILKLFGKKDFKITECLDYLFKKF